ncbi:MAG: NAD(P)H-dependent oxidoreductase [Chloroflexi bacterium]|nr:NAD(P)H-dependent oxidoreductase [Chloroflexota bacterium]
MSVNILVLYDNQGAQVEAMAQAVVEGVSRIQDAQAILRDITTASPEDLMDADGIILGSPNWSGMTGRLKSWLDEMSDLGREGLLDGKVCAAFTVGWGRSSGTEFTLLTLLHWGLSWGMIAVGLPWTDRMVTSGSYYGATVHGDMNPDDAGQAGTLGSRTAQLASYLRAGGMPPTSQG